MVVLGTSTGVHGFSIPDSTALTQKSPPHIIGPQKRARSLATNVVDLHQARIGVIASPTGLEILGRGQDAATLVKGKNLHQKSRDANLAKNFKMSILEISGRATKVEHNMLKFMVIRAQMLIHFLQWCRNFGSFVLVVGIRE